MSTSGHLKFQGTNRATFVGTTSNIMFDTTSTSLGIGVTGTDHPSSNLYITGNAYVSSNIAVGGVLTMGTVNVVARHDLEAVTALGNTTPVTLEFTNPTTSLVASGNVVVTGNVTADHFVGDGSNITGISSTLQAITDSGPGANVTSNTVQFSNATTGFVTTANVEVGGELTVSGNATVSSNLTVSGNVEVGTANLFVDTVNSRIGVGTTSPQNMLHVYKANNDETSGILIEKASGSIPTAAALFFGVASTTETNNNGIPKAAIFYERNLVNGRGDLKFCNDAIDDTNPVSTAASDTRMIIQNNGNVGIGIVSPSTALDVNGIIKQTGANWALTNGNVSDSTQYAGAYPGDYAYLNRTLSTPTNVTLTHENQGGSNTRSRITVGTTGKYAMYINGFRQTGTSGTKELQLQKNGAYVAVRAYSGPEGTDNYATAGSVYTIMDLNANDYVEVYISQSRFHGNDSIYFAGHLIA